MDNFYYDIDALRARVVELEEDELKLSEIKSRMKIGSKIYDLEQNKIGTVTKLKNGSNDFEVDFDDGSYGRGFLFLVPNWKFI